MHPSHSFFFFIIFDFLELRELLFFSGTLNARFLGGVREGRASRHHMSTFVALETKSLLGALLSFFWGKFLDFDCINVHGIGVFGSSRRREGLESLGRLSTLLSDLFHVVSLVLEMDCLRVLVINLFWYSVKGHDSLHEQGGDSSSKATDQDIVVHDAGLSGVALEHQDIALKRGGELPVFLNHVVGG